MRMSVHQCAHGQSRFGRAALPCDLVGGPPLSGCEPFSPFGGPPLSEKDLSLPLILYPVC